VAQEQVHTKAGTVRIVDASNFPAAQMIAAGLVEVESGWMRELHWHPNSDELQYYIEGQGRMSVYTSGSNAGTFDYQACDVGYVPKSDPHYIENTGTTKLRYLELWSQITSRTSIGSLAGVYAVRARQGSPRYRQVSPVEGVDKKDAGGGTLRRPRRISNESSCTYGRIAGRQSGRRHRCCSWDGPRRGDRARSRGDGHLRH
jgi:mannose-6-phosphate isomerase-like protein (cupin superfamily)